MKHRKITVIAIVLLILMVASLISISHWKMSQLDFYEKKEEFTFKVIQHLDHLLQLVHDAKKDKDKFLVSGEQIHLISFYRSLKEVDRDLGVLTELAGDSPWLKQRLAVIELLVTKKLAFLDGQVRLRTVGSGDLSGVKMSVLRDHVAAAKVEAIRQKQFLSTKQEADFFKMEMLLIFNSGIILTLIIAVLLIMRKEIANRIKMNEHVAMLQEQDRLALSREVHDDIGQNLTALKLDLDFFEKRLVPSNEEMSLQLAEMRKNLDQLLTKTQDITAKLRPPLLDNLGLAEAIEWQVNEFRRRSSIEFFLMLNEDIRAHDEKVALGIIRILQEALTNIIRHARATEVSISMCDHRDEFILEISDNGCGITTKEADSVNSFGIMGMRERASLFNGKVVVKGSEQGTIVVLKIPRDALKGKS